MISAVSKYLPIFVDEGRELLERLVRKLLRLEQEPSDKEAMESALRIAHTIKGSAKMVGLDNVSHAAHGVEGLLKGVFGAGRELPADEVGRILQVVDQMTRVLDEVAAGNAEKALDVTLEVGAPAGVKASKAKGAKTKADKAARKAEKPMAPAPRPKAQEASARADRFAADRLRVSTDRLDHLQDLVEDLTVQKWRLVSGMERMRNMAQRMEASGASTEEQELSRVTLAECDEEFHRLDGYIRELREAIMELRMVPLGELFGSYNRVVRDLSQQLGKQVDLVVEGGDTEVDRTLLEGIQAPLTHIVRNALDHGMESPEERKKAGKPERCTLSIRAHHKPGAVVIEVEDDGRGLDADVIREAAVRKGYLSAEEAPKTSDDEAYYLLCRPGFTTRSEADEVSGRGVGLDVVKVRMEALRGSLSIQCERGKFARFRLFLPHSLSSLQGLVVHSGDFRAAVPTIFVEKCLRIDAHRFGREHGTVTYEDERHVAVSLARMFGCEVAPPEGTINVVMLKFRAKHMALAVDWIDRTRELVVKSLGAHLKQTPCVLGLSLLGDGRPTPILDVPDLYARWAGLEGSSPVPMPSDHPALRVLVVDDAVTSRHVESTILEQMGHQVTQARDGEEAWGLLERKRFDLVVTDMEMPKMDGVELVRRIRRMQPLERLPVIMVSAVEEKRGAQKGFEAGVDAFVPKDRLDGATLRKTLRNLFPDA